MSWKLHVIGSGSAFNTKDLQSNFLIESDTGKLLLIDLGSFGPLALEDFGITGANVGEKIDGIFISHLHGDHIGGLEWLAFCTYFNPKTGRPKLFCVDQLMHQLWDRSLRGGLGSVEGKECTLTDYFEGHPVVVNKGFIWENIKFQTIQTVHVMNGMELVPSFGLMIKHCTGTDQPNVFLTTDTQFCPNQISKFYDQADLILHDCETAPYYSKVHAHYDELRTLSDEIKSKMWLYHYQPDPSQDPQKDLFKGFLKRGQILEF